ASAFGQISVSGTVVFDETGEALPNASVVVKGSKNGIFTDENGNYKLDDVPEDGTLVVSYIGFDTQEVPVNGRTVVGIRMVENIRDLDPVVVVGYGTQRKSDLTGAVGTVAVDALVQAPISNFDQALAGRVAGVQVTTGQGTPGDEASIVIRGGNSITGDNSPLFVIDGVPFQDFDPASINTNDIKSIDVLKDASATAIYGSRGANGVILITTKSGRTDGKSEVTFKSNQGTQFVATRLPVMGPYEYVTHIERLALMQDGFNPGSETQNFIETWVDPELYRDAEGTDWQEQIFQQASFRDYGLSVSAGNKTTRLYYSGQYVDQEGTVINTGFDKVVNNVRLNQKVGQRIKVDASLMHSLSNRTGVGVNGNGFSGIIIRDVIRFRPVEPINDDDLDGFDPESGDGRWLYNPVDNLNNTDRRDRRELFRGTLNAEAKIIKPLTLVGTASYQSQNRRNSVFNGAQTF
ncbi:MAG: SusC/RagA family TonB-linked outer membrane protein, partial [Bacteroidota bacterium]